MKKLLIMLIMSIIAFQQTYSQYDNALKGKKVLFVYGGWDGHEPVPCRDLFVPWLQAEGASVILSDSLGVYTNERLMSDIDLVIQVWTMGSITNEEENGLLNAVKRGVGIAGWHGGLGDSFRNNTEYQFMVGGQWVAHPGNVIDYDVTVTDKNDPVTKGLNDFHMKSEQYYVHLDPNVKVLATTKYNGNAASWIDGCVIPVAWKKVYGKGRVFYSSLGHIAKDFEVPEALEIMKRGIRWASLSKYETEESWLSPVYAQCGNTQQNTLSTAEQADGWKLLFDGKTTKGWRGAYKSAFPDKGWVVRDGTLTITKEERGGDIITEDEYSAFILSFEFKITKGANSGLKYFVPENDPDKKFIYGLEFQVLDDAEHKDANLYTSFPGSRKCSGLYDLIKPENVHFNGVGEWNQGVVKVFPNNHVEHWLNGHKVLEYERGSAAFRQLVKGSKFAAESYNKYGKFGEHKKGHILLQDHGDEVSYRNIKIKIIN